MLSQTGSLAGGNVPFDLNAQSGVMQLLLSVRASALSPAQKNELRDTIFLYTNGGGDPSIRIALLKKIEAYKLVPVAPLGRGAATAPEAPAPVRPFGNSRPVPVFAGGMFTPSVVTKASPKVVPAMVPTPPQTVPPVTSVSRGIVPKETAPIKRIEVTPAEVAAEIIAPVVSSLEPVPAPMSVPPRVPPVAAPTLPPAASIVPATPVAAAVNPYIDRIREIKHAVNEKVGNPVNLVDINNTVGREYMMALLEAMKKMSGGMPGEIEAAMVRLEAAFAQVEQAIATYQTPVAVPVPVPAPVAAPTSLPVAPAPVRIESSFDTNSAQTDSVQLVRGSLMDKMIEDVEASPPLRPIRVQVEERAAETATSFGAEAPFAAASPGANRVPQFRAASLAENTKPLLTPDALVDPATHSASGQGGDLLMTAEIDTGLDQLLLEWPIFKKSGLFGTGPKGAAHPLFKQLAPLTIPLILAGRYDGASPEIRQSVTDYMNGWRYEQGLVYSEEETFEHYLRRVIRHIIDLQKRRVSA